MTVPTTAEIKQAYANGGDNYGERCLNFDKWLTNITLLAYRDGYNDGYDDSCSDGD